MRAMDCLPAGVKAAGVERVLSPGQALFRLGDRTMGIYGIIKGQVQMVRIDAGGREVVLFAAGAGGVFSGGGPFAPPFFFFALTKTGGGGPPFSQGKVLGAVLRGPKTAAAVMALRA